MSAAPAYAQKEPLARPRVTRPYYQPTRERGRHEAALGRQSGIAKLFDRLIWEVAPITTTRICEKSHNHKTGTKK
ncbi:hypothetical protein TRIATDRAFT_299686, partial [Trichoderma atroviride IMI 206040]